VLWLLVFLSRVSWFTCLVFVFLWPESSSDE
jgi:hypothetical protein